MSLDRRATQWAIAWRNKLPRWAAEFFNYARIHDWLTAAWLAGYRAGRRARQ